MHNIYVHVTRTTKTTYAGDHYMIKGSCQTGVLLYPIGSDGICMHTLFPWLCVCVCVWY